MPRSQPYNARKGKQMFDFYDFSGGMNAAEADPVVGQNEFRYAENLELISAGSLATRSGARSLITFGATEFDYVQGYFDHKGAHYVIADGWVYDESGNAVTKNDTNGFVTQPFQTNKIANALYYEATDKTYIASGTQFLEFDGTDIKLVKPYAPTSTELNAFGENLLSPTPLDHISNETNGMDITQLTAVMASKRFGVCNVGTDFTVYYNKPAGGVLEFLWEFRQHNGDGTIGSWVTIRDWTGEAQGGLTATAVFQNEAKYDIRVAARHMGDQTAKPEDLPVDGDYIYLMPEYQVHKDDRNNIINFDDLGKCNQIMLYWDRVYLYGGDDNIHAIYVSALQDPTFFPLYNTLEFDTNEYDEPITKIVKFRDTLVVFTAHTIQMLQGKHPGEWKRTILNTNVGCAYGETAKVLGNHLFFTTFDGIYAMHSLYNSTSEERVNVKRVDYKIDTRIRSLLEYYNKNYNDRKIRDSVIAMTWDSQYFLFVEGIEPNLKTPDPDDYIFSQTTMVFRYYYKYQCWTLDTYNFMFYRVFFRSHKLYALVNTQVANPEVAQLVEMYAEGVYTDMGNPYKIVYEEASEDFEIPYNLKKFKQLQILFDTRSQGIVDMNFWVSVDEVEVVSPTTYNTYIDEEQNLVVRERVDEVNVRFGFETILGDWELGAAAFGDAGTVKHILKFSGKGRTIRFRYEVPVTSYFEMLGYAYIFKLKKPK